MNTHPKAMLLLAAACLPAWAVAQPAGYVDAFTPGEAVGMMQTTQLTARIMREQCGNRFPALALEIDGNLAKWQAREAAAIRKSDFHWAEMVRKDAGLGRHIPVVEAAIRKNLAAVSGIPGEAGARAFAQVCSRHFAALASGAWRTRTPNAYKYLDDAP
jgi:hypothetical protein